jgi:hypothetical protein
MKRIELEDLGHDDLHTEYRNSNPKIEFYDWLKLKWPDLLGVRTEPKMDFEDPQDRGMPWAYCYFLENESDRTWFALGGK